MTDLRFPRWLAAIGVFGGVMIALILPVVVLMLGNDLSARAKLTVIILAMIIGACLAGISAIVGITIPSTIAGAAIKISENGITTLGGNGCCIPAEDCCPPDPQKPDGTPDI